MREARESKAESELISSVETASSASTNTSISLPGSRVVVVLFCF